MIAAAMGASVRTRAAPSGQLRIEFAARRGLALTTLDISEFEKGGGGLTCLSLLWSPE